MVPANKVLFAGTVPANKVLFSGTVPTNKVLFAGTVPANNSILFKKDLLDIRSRNAIMLLNIYFLVLASFPKFVNSS